MAQIKNALELTLKYEGDYSKDKDDTGGETLFGISRKNNPTWQGWAIIDEIKKKNFGLMKPESVNEFKKSHFDLVTNLYKTNYWDKCKLDDVKSQEIANQIFDIAVNMGVNKASKLLQEILGVTVDGIIGSQTIEKLNSHPNINFVNNNLVQHRISGYFAIYVLNLSQSKFLRGWINRASGYIV